MFITIWFFTIRDEIGLQGYPQRMRHCTDILKDFIIFATPVSVEFTRSLLSLPHQLVEFTRLLLSLPHQLVEFTRLYYPCHIFIKYI